MPLRIIVIISHLLRSSKGEDSSNTSASCEQNNATTMIQLVGGRNKFEGRVEICQDGQWKTVCNRGWGDREARVVCRQLEFAEDSRCELLKLIRLAFTDYPCITGYNMTIKIINS